MPMKTEKIEPHKSSLGMDANIASLVIYVAMAVVSWLPYLGWLSWCVPLVFFFMEKQSKFVKFQAVNALVIGVIRAALAIVFQILIWAATPKTVYGALTGLGAAFGAYAILGFISTLIGLAITVAIIYFVYMAWNYKQVELPVIGPIAVKAAEKLSTVNIGANQPAGSQKADDNGGAETNTETGENKADEKQSAVTCQNCGAELEGQSAFCPKCGTKR